MKTNEVKACVTRQLRSFPRTRGGDPIGLRPAFFMSSFSPHTRG